MRSRRAWVSATALLAGAGVGVVSGGGEARADAKQECAAAYEQTQALRDAGKLIDARKNALACSAAACAGFIVKECTQWLAQIDASLPSVVFEARDANGAETSAVQITLDGKPWLQELDGKAKPIDPGPHSIRYAMAGAEPRDETVQIREGEKNRKLTVSFKKVVTSEVGPVMPPVAPPPPDVVAPSHGSTVGPWVVGGIGLVGLVAGGVMGGIVLHDKSITDDRSQCSPTLKMCTTAGANAEQQGRTLGPATTAALVVGGAAVAAAGIWLGLRGSGKKPAVAMRMEVGGGATTCRLTGTW
jgi:hypothetical protein